MPTDRPETRQSSWLPALLQLSDSQLPIGAYAHSLGFEGLVQLHAIRSEADLETFLKRELLGSLSETDLPLLLHLRQAMTADDMHAVTRLDQLAWAVRPTAELRAAATRMGRQLITLAPRVLPDDPATTNEFKRIEARLPKKQSVSATALIQHLARIPVDAGLTAYAWQTLTGASQAGLKLLHLGPSGIQAILARRARDIHAAVRRALELTEDDIGSFTPLWDIASSRHERAGARLFIS